MPRSIEDIINSIRTAVYGRDVRGSIAEGIETCYTNVQSGVTIAQTAASTANTAATNANNKASAAQSAATTAQSAATTARTAATNAQAAGQQAVSIAQAAAAVLDGYSDVVNLNSYGKPMTYVGLKSYGPKTNNGTQDRSPQVNSVTNGSITMYCDTTFMGVVYKIHVKKNTTFNVGFEVNISSGNCFSDITNANQATQIRTGYTTAVSGSHVYSFNSGNYNEILIRIGNGNTTNATLTVSNLWIYQISSAMVDSSLTKEGYVADAKAAGDASLTSKQYTTQYTGWMNYWEGVLTYSSGAGWAYSDFIEVYPNSVINYTNLDYFTFPSNHVAVAYIAFFNANKELIEAYNWIDDHPSSSMQQGKISGTITTIPTGAAYVRFTMNTSTVDRAFYIVSKASDMVVSVKNEVDDINKRLDPLNPDNIGLYDYANKINIIGDSITQGVGAQITYDDSYAGILRKMFMVEHDGLMNYGFEPFPSLAELSPVTETMVNKVSSSGFTRKWNGIDCYGSDEWSSSTEGSTLVFSTNHKFDYMRISYKGGVDCSFIVKAGTTLLSTISSTSGTVGPALSNAINISNLSANQQYTIQVVSGTVTVSGVELGMDPTYPVFNNYGRAGISVDVVMGTLLSAESNCDLLIYALGTNGEVTENKIQTLTTTLSASRAKIVILDLCMKSNQYDNTAKSALLQKLANNLNAKYIRMYSYIPKNFRGYTDSTYFLSDGLHPSILGHKCIAEVLAKVLKLSVQSKGLVNSAFSEW